MAVGKLFTKALDFQNVVKKGTATLKYVPRRTLHRIVLKLGGGLQKSHLKSIKIKVNASTKIETTGSDLDKINRYRGVPTDSDFLALDFTEIYGRDYVDQVVGAWDTSAGFNTVNVEIDIDSSADNPTLEAYLDESAAQSVDPNQSVYAGAMYKLLEYPWDKSNGGKLPIDLPFGNRGAIIKRLHVTHSGNLTDVEVKEDKVVIFEGGSEVIRRVQEEFGLSPQSGMLTVDFMVDGNVKNCWDTRNAGTVELNLDLSGGDHGVVYAEFLDLLGNL